MEEIKLNMENLSKEEREQLLKLVEKANKKESKVWVPEPRYIYYLISSEGEITQSIWCGSHPIDKNRYLIGNCFKTQEEAEFALERQKVIVELERFAKEHNDTNKHSCRLLRYDNECSFSSAIGVYNYGAAVIPTFTSDRSAMEAVETIGKDRIKKYYFGVKE